MRPFLAQFSEPVWSGHLPSWADFITTTSGFRFSVHTAGGGRFCCKDGSSELPQHIVIIRVTTTESRFAASFNCLLQLPNSHLGDQSTIDRREQWTEPEAPLRVPSLWREKSPGNAGAFF
jgi:hypothetical protein